MNNKWILTETDANLTLMAKTLGINEITANVMANRGIRSKNTALTFLSPSINSLFDVLEMNGAKEALNNISNAIKNNEKIVIYGDYDADGIMSVVILYKVLLRLGANISYYIPHRQKEGYGLNITAIEKLAKEDTRLIIAVDNGITAVEEVSTANKLGMSVVIIDHHEPTETLPAAVAIVDPKQHDCNYPFKEMCAAGIVYKIAAGLCAHMNSPFEEQDEMIVLATIATLCDIVTLSDENRILVNCGLTILNANKLINPGLGSLITLRGYLDKPIDTFTIGFILGPCLNAAGRLESASLSVELLLAEDFNRRMEIAHKLAGLNENRKTLTSECVDRVLQNLDMNNMDKVLVISDTTAHESVAGIVAGRIREATNRPTIVLTQGDGAMKGSGRSIVAYNLFDALNEHNHLFTRFGGHAMAAGLTLSPENIPLLKEALNKNCTLTEDDFRTIIEFDRELTLDDITLKLSDELSRLAPFGKGNEEPLFVSHGLLAEHVRVIDDKNTLIFTYYSPSGGKIKGVAFGLNDMYAKKITAAGINKCGGFIMDAVYSIETNVYNGVSSVQIRIKDFEVSR